MNARHLSSNTDQSTGFWPLDLLTKRLVLANKKEKFLIDLVYAYGHATTDDGIIKLTAFSSGDILFAFIGKSHCVKDSPKVFTEQMSTSFN